MPGLLPEQLLLVELRHLAARGSLELTAEDIGKMECQPIGQSRAALGNQGLYQARQISLGRKVAPKILRSAALADDRQLQRFENEARAAALLDHPGIVPIFGVGSERGIHYFTMQYIHGPTLADVLRGLRSVDDRVGVGL